MTTKLTAYNAPDRQLAAWIRSVEAFVRSVAQTVRIEATWNDDNAPVTVRTALTVTPSSVQLLSATTGTGTMISGAPITWTWDDGSIVISAIGTLSASTDYDLVLGVVV